MVKRKSVSGFTPLEADRPKAIVAAPSAGRPLTGFTLIELLIVVGILIVLLAIAILLLNPGEIIAQGRDSQRISDLKRIDTALSLAQNSLYESLDDRSSPNIVYVSLPDINSNVNDDCKNSGEYPTLPALATGWGYRCVAVVERLKYTDGNGWIPVNFNSIAGNPLKSLPVDPVNDATNYYTFSKPAFNESANPNSYTLSTPIKSEKYLASYANNANGDGGKDDLAFETRPVGWFSGGSAHITAIAAGGGSTFALIGNSPGIIKGWGWNANAQLGDGTTADKTTPVSVSGITNAVAVSAGDSHTCAALADGTMKCWGWNIFGQLGDGTLVNKTTPVSVSGITNAVAVSAGYYHTCAALSDGTMKCWGYNTFGQLGNGTQIDSATPVSVSGITNAVAVATGINHTCAALSDGTVNCWGFNSAGQLGDGTLVNKTTPVSVSGITNAVAVAGGWKHTCAALSDGTMKCWGFNVAGQLGDGSAWKVYPVSVIGL